jgi:hypothetical protein
MLQNVELGLRVRWDCWDMVRVRRYKRVIAGDLFQQKSSYMVKYGFM